MEERWREGAAQFPRPVHAILTEQEAKGNSDRRDAVKGGSHFIWIGMPGGMPRGVQTGRTAVCDSD